MSNEFNFTHSSTNYQNRIRVCLSLSRPKYKQLRLWILKTEAHLDFYKATRTEYNKNIRNKKRVASSWTA